MPVPTTAQVIPGASVSIVLKADQPTGRQVQGTVQNVLTSGNHPRGIKVRLSDGRVGRVQRMQQHAAGGEPSIPDDQTQPANHPVSRSQRPHRERDGRRSRFQSRDVRLDEDGEAPAEQVDLFAYVKPSRQQQQQKKRGAARQTQEDVLGEEVITETAGIATCPVCGEFEGDETAVAHHVETHFT